jgi:pyrroline-5-carboxylate reductase
MTDRARLIIVGCGHMGFAIVRGLLGAAHKREIVVVETSAERRKFLLAHSGMTITEELAIAPGDFVVLAVPPQVFGEFARNQRDKFSPGTPVLSVMAGLTAHSIAEALGTTQVVRAIPNTPSEVFAGMAVYYADVDVAELAIAQADELLKTIGKALRVDNEELVDDATALCGGGPAFVSYVADAFCRFAVSCGFTEATGREMTVQIFGGTAALISNSDKTPMQLCREVMTPNGTTERGIAAFDAADLTNSVLTALAASAHRSRELASSMSTAAGHGANHG